MGGGWGGEGAGPVNTKWLVPRIKGYNIPPSKLGAMPAPLFHHNRQNLPPGDAIGLRPRRYNLAGKMRAQVGCRIRLARPSPCQQLDATILCCLQMLRAPKTLSESRRLQMTRPTECSIPWSRAHLVTVVFPRCYPTQRQHAEPHVPLS